MTKPLEEAIERLRSLPDSEQDAAAFAVMDLLEARRDSVLTDEQIAEIERRLAEPEGPLLSLDEVRARLRSRHA